MQLPVYPSRGFKLPGIPKITQSKIPSGLRRCITGYAPGFYDVAGQFQINPSRIGSGTSLKNSQLGNVISFDGTANGFVGYNIDQPPICSIEIFVLVGSTTSNQFLVGFNSSSDGTGGASDRGICLTSASQFSFDIFDGAHKIITDTTTVVNPNTFYHVVCTTDGVTENIYTNGIKTATGSAGTAFQGYTTPFIVIGSGIFFNQNSAKNTTCSVSIMNFANIAWTDAEVLERYRDIFGFLDWPIDDVFETLVGVTVVPPGPSKFNNFYPWQIMAA